MVIRIGRVKGGAAAAGSGGMEVPHSGSLIRKYTRAEAGRLHGFEIDKAENNRYQCPSSPQALPAKLIGRRGGANSKLRIYSGRPGPLSERSGPVACFLYCSPDNRDNNAGPPHLRLSAL